MPTFFAFFCPQPFLFSACQGVAILATIDLLYNGIWATFYVTQQVEDAANNALSQLEPVVSRHAHASAGGGSAHSFAGVLFPWERRSRHDEPSSNSFSVAHACGFLVCVHALLTQRARLCARLIMRQKGKCRRMLASSGSPVSTFWGAVVLSVGSVELDAVTYLVHMWV